MGAASSTTSTGADPAAERSSASPLITVVIPTFNRADGYLQEAIDSVLVQSFPDFVVLVSDNASVDGTTEVVRGYADPRIAYVRRPENIGWLRNFNAALSEVTTEYVTILNDDDLMRPGALERAMSALESSPTVGLLHSAFDSIGPSGELLASGVNWTHGLHADTSEPGQRFIGRSMRYLGRVCPPSAVMRTRALPDPPFDPEDEQSSDHTLHLSIALDWDVLFLCTPGMAWRGHEGQDSSSMIYITPEGAQALHLEAIWTARDAKLRFIRLHAPQLRRPRFLRWQVVRFVSYELVDRGVAALDSGPRAVLRELARGLRCSPTFAFEPRAWRLVVRAVLGKHLWAAAKRLLGRGR